jgi:hypothetical protein
MAFSHGPQAQDETAAVPRGAGLIGMEHDARIEQGRCLEGVFVQEIRANQTALHLALYGVRGKRLLHLGGARREDVDEVPVAAVEALQNFGQL